MKEYELKAMRELAGLTQIQLASYSGVSRMKLSLAECGQVELNPQERAELQSVLEKSIRGRITFMNKLLANVKRQAVAL